MVAGLDRTMHLSVGGVDRGAALIAARIFLLLCRIYPIAMLHIVRYVGFMADTTGPDQQEKPP